MSFSVIQLDNKKDEFSYDYELIVQCEAHNLLILHSGSDTETVHILLILLSSAALTKSCEERIAERLNVKIRKHY
jgi:hypothetical protein